jgi:hypothetical protein
MGGSEKEKKEIIYERNKERKRQRKKQGKEKNRIRGKKKRETITVSILDGMPCNLVNSYKRFWREQLCSNFRIEM